MSAHNMNGRVRINGKGLPLPACSSRLQGALLVLYEWSPIGRVTLRLRDAALRKQEPIGMCRNGVSFERML